MVSSNQLKGVDNLATTKNITMKQFNGTDYDTLYPKTKVEQVEGAYTQQQILANSTKTLYGLDATAVPDDILVLLKSMISNVETKANKAQTTANGRAKIETFNYVGNGYTSKQIKFSFNPKCVIITSNNRDYSRRPIIITISGVKTVGTANNTSIRVEIVGNWLYLEDIDSINGFVSFLNDKNTTYYGIAIG